MTFREYCTTKEFQKSLLRKRWSGKKTKIECGLAAFIAVLAVAWAVVAYLTDDMQKHAWFIAYSVTTAVLCFAGIAADFALCALSGNWRGADTYGEGEWALCGVGLTLYMREQHIDWNAFFSNGVLDVPIFLPPSALNRKGETAAVTVGDTRLDFSPWGKVFPLTAYSCVAVGVIGFLESPPVSLMSAGVHYATEGLGAESATKYIAWVRNGKWTLEGKRMRRRVRRAHKKIQKKGY